MIRLFFLILVGALHSHSIVFVHIGPSLPKHLFVTIEQARFFNRDCPLYLIANRDALLKKASLLKEQNVTPVPCEELPPSIAHQQFSLANRSAKLASLWIYSSERFFYLDDFVSENQLQDVFHLENDVMLYADLEELLPIFRKNYSDMIAATFENDERCVAGFMYISSPPPLRSLVESFPEKVALNQTDMESISDFKKLYYKVKIDHLPIVLPEYAKDHTLKYSPSQISEDPDSFSNHFDDFGAIFDAAAWGVYLAGWDSAYHQECHPGAKTPLCVFDPALFEFRWEMDLEGRRIPFVSYKCKSMRIYNLHITNKIRVAKFLSIPKKLQKLADGRD